MKKILTLILVLGMILALAACGDTKQADVVENVDPVNNSVVIETPPAIVSGPDTPTETYPAVNALPTTAPTTAPDPAATSVPAPNAAPGETGTGTGSGTGTEGTGSGTGTEGTGTGTGATPEPTEDPGLPYNATVTQFELNHGKTGYVVRAENGVFFRVGPGKEYEIICGLKIGTPVLIVDEMASGWCKVVYDDNVGFIYGSYLSYTDPMTPVIVTETPAPSATPAPTAVVIVP